MCCLLIFKSEDLNCFLNSLNTKKCLTSFRISYMTGNSLNMRSFGLSKYLIKSAFVNTKVNICSATEALVTSG